MTICSNNCLECEHEECLKDIKRKESLHKYYLKNKDKVLESNKKRKEANPEAYYQYHREYSKRYSMTHDRTEYFKEYYRKRKDKKNDRVTKEAIYQLA